MAQFLSMESIRHEIIVYAEEPGQRLHLLR